MKDVSAEMARGKLQTLVIFPSSIVAMVAASSASQNLVRSALPSSFARCASPRVQAKIDATGFVLVVFPFWCCLQCLVTVPTCVTRPHIKERHINAHTAIPENDSSSCHSYA